MLCAAVLLSACGDVKADASVKKDSEKEYAIEEDLKKQYIDETDKVFREFLEALHSGDTEKAEPYLDDSCTLTGLEVKNETGTVGELIPEYSFEDRTFSFMSDKYTMICAYNYSRPNGSDDPITGLLYLIFTKSEDGWLIKFDGFSI